VQALADVHDTSSRIGCWAAEPAGFGVGWIAQLAPSQRSANVAVEELVKSHPTAVQFLAEVHDTPKSSLLALGTFGVCWIDQLAAPADAGSAAISAVRKSKPRTQVRPPIHPRERHTPSRALKRSDHRYIENLPGGATASQPGIYHLAERG
jgi:hypothetical protein